MKNIVKVGIPVLGIALCYAVIAQSQQAVPAKVEVKKTQGSAQSIQAAPAQPQVPGIKFCECSWATAVSKAKLEKKAIFVDAYASWCGPCKYMKKIIFTNAEVGDFYNKNFVNMALDWEKAESVPLHGKYPLRAYPTLMFVNPITEEVVAVAEGALDGSNMIAFGNYGLSMLNKNSKVPETKTPEPEPTMTSTQSVPVKKETTPKEKGLMDKVSDFFKGIF